MVSRDESELALAMSFVHEQELAQRSRLLLPVSPHTAQPSPAPVATSFYSSLDDIVAAVDEFEPHLVFLFSAYWFSLEGVASAKGLGAFLRRVRSKGRRVITSDPFLGLAPRLTLAEIDPRMLALERGAVARWLTRVIVSLRGSRTKLVTMPSLEGVTHLYPALPPDSDDGIERISFFNSTFLRPTAKPGFADGKADRRELHVPQSVWLFVLSNADFNCQLALLGLREFTECLLRMLRYAVEVDRRATLIAPAPVIDRLATAVPASVELLSSCSFAERERRLLQAEYAFFWDAFSFDQFVRLANDLPVFFFDRGYMARTIQPFYRLACACHLGGWEPPYLDQRQIFSPYVLAHLAKAQAPITRALRERWQSSPTPDALVTGLLHAGVRPERA